MTVDMIKAIIERRIMNAQESASNCNRRGYPTLAAEFDLIIGELLELQEEIRHD